jgi:hypothetical protein
LANVVTFRDYVPIPRYDNKPFTHVLVYEAATRDGPWTEIADLPLIPVDADPRNPQSRNLTVETATLDEGWYYLLFKDVDNDQQLPTEPVHNRPTDTLPYMPLVSDVGALLNSRTKDKNGNYAGTFTADTRPTFEQVSQLIQQAADDITAGLDTDIPEGAWRFVKEAIKTRAAMLVELSFYSDQVNTQRSVYPQLQEDLKELLPQIERSVIREEEEATGGEFGLATRPSYGFPEPSGFETRRM